MEDRTDATRANSEISNRFSRRFQVKLIVEGSLVGLFGGGVVALYRLALSHAESTLRTVTSLLGGSVLGIIGWFAILAVVMLVVGRLMLWEPYTQGSGIPQTDAEVMGRIDMPWHRVMGAKFVEGTLCALAGLSLGREGPSVQLGGMAGKAVSRLFHRNRGEERLLVTCGAAAGMSAAFHAPLTGVMFALEEIHREFTAPLIISVMAASVVSDFLVSQILGVSPVLHLVFITDLPHMDYLFVVVMGIYCGLLGALHNRGMFLCQRLYSLIDGGLPYARLAVPFTVAGIMAFTFPQFMCGGDAIMEVVESGHLQALSVVAALLVGKYLFTTVSFGSGAPGGTLFPLVVMGSLSGMAFGLIAIRFFGFSPVYLPNFIVLGVAGLFSGVVRAPVTAVVLCFELSGSLDALLSVAIISILSYMTANMLKTDAFYEHLLARLLGVTPDDPSMNGKPGEKIIKQHHVGAGSRIEGMKVRDVPWPDQVRIVTIDRAGEEIVPTGDTTLMALDEMLIIMNSDLEDDAELKLGMMCRPNVYGRSTPTNQ